MDRVKFFRCIFMGVVFAALGGCGGGGGGDTPPPTPPSPPVNISKPFGDVRVGETSTLSVSLEGKGIGGVRIGALPALPAPFSIVNDQCSSKTISFLNPCTFEIRFAPTAAGSFSHSFDVPSNGDNKVTVSVSGRGVALSPPPPAAKWGTKQFGTAAIDVAWGVATDAGGNVYVAGHTEGGLDGNTSAGSGDVFLVKYNPEGTKLWTRQLGTTSADEAYGVAADANGNVYVAGYTEGGLGGNTQAGSGDAFVIKYDSGGTRLWARQFGTTSVDSAMSVAVDAGGGVYVAGLTLGDLDGNTSAGLVDGFVVKYDSAGTKLWSRQVGTTSIDTFTGVAVDASGNVYLSGGTDGALDGNTSAGSMDGFVVKYDSAGTKLWTRQIGTAGNDSALGVATAGGHVYLAGYTAGALDGGASKGSEDAFIVKYDSSGAKVWTRQFGTSLNNAARAIVADGAGNVYVAGRLWRDDSIPGWEDYFVAKYDSLGTEIWRKAPISTGTDIANGIAMDGGGNIYAAGYTAGNLDGNTSLGLQDAFVVKYDTAGTKQ